MLKSIAYPSYRRYKSRSEWEPVGFFSECLCNATRFDLMLGFFSSSAFNVLADGFAAFIYNGGNMRLIINDILSEEDKDFISIGKSDVIIPCFNLENIEILKETLSERSRHFFECLAFLIRNKRLSIKIIRPKDNSGISHTKSGMFSDGVNSVSFDGSCNFSKTALLDNIESITAFCDWDGDVQKANTERFSEDFEFVFSGQDDSVEYLEAEDVTTRIAENFPEKSVMELLEDEQKIHENDSKSGVLSASVIKALSNAKQIVEDLIKIFHSHNKEVEKISNEPRFPFERPRNYQIQAFQNWKDNKQKGFFAMATGTGKTLTSLNCLLEIYKHSGYYKAIILVPTKTLVDQWEKECLRFNFSNVIKVYSNNHNWRNQISDIIALERISDKISYVIISTYTSFAMDKNFDTLNSLPHKKVLLIADEAHNMGAGSIRRKMDNIKYARRIGLSATPERPYDEEWCEVFSNFFRMEKVNAYTFEYNMKQAIDDEFLCKYLYYPHIISLTEDEMNAYSEISAKIAKFYNGEKNGFQNNPILTALLLKRKRIIHKAENKLVEFQRIINEQYERNGNLKYTLVYVPEGNQPNDDDFEEESYKDDDFSEHLIDQYTEIVKNSGEMVTVRKFTSETVDKDNLLRDFASGKVEVLTSMKCLDEGVDVPRSEFAIFCASTGNPRQFIQRRGRILRTHPGKDLAIIHDLIVAPKVMNENTFNMERSLLKGELRRVRDFAMWSLNSSESVIALTEIMNYYKLTLN